MIVPGLCMVAFILLLWVIVLKLRIDDLKKENKKLRTILERNLIKIDESAKLTIK